MLQRIDTLPSGVWGIRAIGKVSKSDYDAVLLPALEAARRDGGRIRFLYHFGPQFDGFTAGAAWEDMRLGVQYLRLFERCAVITDIDWIQTATRVIAPLMPCPVKVFANAQWDEAVVWTAATREPSVSYSMKPDIGVLVIEPHASLRPEDFDAIAAEADQWIESAGSPLRGIVIHAKAFPGWENLGSLLRHIRFVKDYHRRIPRVALASDAALGSIAASLVDHFVVAKIKRYDYDDFECAIAWAGGRASDGRAETEPHSAQT